MNVLTNSQSPTRRLGTMLPDGMRYASMTKARMARKIATSAMSDLKDSHVLPDDGALPRAWATEPLGLEFEERLRDATVKRVVTREVGKCALRVETWESAGGATATAGRKLRRVAAEAKGGRGKTRISCRDPRALHR